MVWQELSLGWPLATHRRNWNPNGVGPNNRIFATFSLGLGPQLRQLRLSTRLVRDRISQDSESAGTTTLADNTHHLFTGKPMGRGIGAT